jgi:hypothetical protein
MHLPTAIRRVTYGLRLIKDLTKDSGTKAYMNLTAKGNLGKERGRVKVWVRSDGLRSVA